MWPVCQVTVTLSGVASHIYAHTQLCEKLLSAHVYVLFEYRSGLISLQMEWLLQNDLY